MYFAKCYFPDSLNSLPDVASPKRLLSVHSVAQSILPGSLIIVLYHTSYVRRCLLQYLFTNIHIFL